MKKLLTICFLFTNFLTLEAQNLVFTKNEKYGIKDSLGKVIVSPKYDYIDNLLGYCYTIARVQKKGKWGLISSKGIEIVEPRYDSIGVVSDYRKYIDIQNNGKWGLLDFEGKEVITPKYTNKIRFYEDGFFIICTEDPNGPWNSELYGVLDNSLNEVIKPKYRTIEYKAFGYFKVSLNKDPSKYGLIDINNNVIFDFKHDHISVVSKDIISIEKNKKWVLVNKKGISISNEEYDLISLLFENRAFVRKNYKYGYIDEQGKEIITCQYDKAGKFIDGKAKVRNGADEFFINKNGERIK